MAFGVCAFARERRRTVWVWIYHYEKFMDYCGSVLGRAWSSKAVQGEGRDAVEGHFTTDNGPVDLQRHEILSSNGFDVEYALFRSIK